MLPALTLEFRIMPWHFGGEKVLSYAEADEYLDMYEQIAKTRKEEMKKSRAGSRGSNVRRGRRR